MQPCRPSNAFGRGVVAMRRQNASTAFALAAAVAFVAGSLHPVTVWPAPRYNRQPRTPVAPDPALLQAAEAKRARRAARNLGRAR